MLVNSIQTNNRTSNPRFSSIRPRSIKISKRLKKLAQDIKNTYDPRNTIYNLERVYLASKIPFFKAEKTYLLNSNEFDDQMRIGEIIREKKLNMIFRSHNVPEGLKMFTKGFRWTLNRFEKAFADAELPITKLENHQ